jgi:hypothetical protein
MITTDQYIGAMRWAFISLGSQSLTAAIIAAVPFLGVPPLKQLVGAIVSSCLEMLVKFPEMMIFFKYVDFRVNAQGKALFEAAMKNFEIRDHGTDEEKKLAKDDLHAKFRNFAMLAS